MAHGSTTFEDGDFRPKPAELLAGLVAWARRVLAAAVTADPGLAAPMDLGGRVLGDAYERSTALAKWYSASAMPDDDRLHADDVRFAGFLRAVYEAEDLGRAPGSVPPEVAEVTAAAAGAPQRRRAGQGFGLTAAQRQAVEQRAMAVARVYLEDRQWRVTDVSAQGSFDFLCRRRDEEMVVEVKETTSAGEQVVVTRNEVAVQRTRYPNNALIVVRWIVLRDGAGGPSAEGGELLAISPWEVRDEELRPLAYQYAVPADDIGQ